MATLLSPGAPLLYILLAPLTLLLLWHLTSTITPPPPPPPPLSHNKRIVLLIAHPDDESMFFSPTITRLTDPTLGNHVKVLCLSTGNADGLGETRRKELQVAAVGLGVRRAEDVYVLDDVERFRDGMGEIWDEKEIARVLSLAFLEPVETSRKGKGDGEGGPPPKATIDALITFDNHGVSSHPNHIALYHGARLFLSQLKRDHPGYACPVALYTLTSINMLRKYSFFLDVVPTYLAGVLGDVIDGVTGVAKKKGKGMGKGGRAVFVSDLGRYWRGRDAMVNGHVSQMVWFRWGWITIGRYMFVNDLRREDV